MSDDNQKSEGSQDSIDWLLRMFVNLANTGAEIGITVTVGGAMISGQLSSGKRYFNDLADGMEKGLRAAGVDDVGAIPASLKEAAERLYPSDYDGSGTAYIHIREARYFLPGQPAIPQNGMWWRGKLSAIDAFSMGNLLP